MDFIENKMSGTNPRNRLLFLKGLYLKYKLIAVYGTGMSLLLFLLKWFQWKFLITDNSLEVYIGLIALFFTLLGIWVARQLAKPEVKTVVVEKEILVQPQNEFTLNAAELEKLCLSQREWEVLQLVCKGMSNKEIAGEMFLSLSTVKTHVSNVLVKLDVKSRTKAIEKSKRMKIIP